MKRSDRFFLALAGIGYILLALYLFANPGRNIAAFSWMLSLGLFVSAVSAIVTYFTVPRELRHPVYLWQGILEVVVAGYLLAYGYVTLPIVIPTVLGIWLIFEGIVTFVKGRRLSIVLPIIGSNLTWISLLAILLGLLLFFHPLFASVFVIYLLAFGFLVAGIQYILEAFRK